MHTYIQVLLEREKLYIAGCLTTLMSYKECLAVALQEGALDITVAILRAQRSWRVPPMRLHLRSCPAA